MAILNAYGQMLVSGTDPSNVRSVLFSMQNVNERSRLYQRALFKEQLLASFQRALLNLLLSGEGSLHFDMIAQALYAMGQVDRRQLLESFVHASLPVAQTSLEEICQTNVSQILNIKGSTPLARQKKKLSSIYDLSILLQSYCPCRLVSIVSININTKLQVVVTLP